jgi:hypothetical protein
MEWVAWEQCGLPLAASGIALLKRSMGSPLLSHVKISRGFVKNRLKITSETKEWEKIILKP